MSKKILLIAGVLLAAGSAVAISAPDFLDEYLHIGPLGAIFGDKGEEASPAGERRGQRHKAADADRAGAGTREEPRSRRKSRFDPNGDDAVDAAEFAAGAKDGADRKARRFMQRFDADRDGKVSRDEFTKGRRERSAMRDHDEDGRVGLEDQPAGGRDRAGRRRGRDSADAKDNKDSMDASEDGARVSLEDQPSGGRDRAGRRRGGDSADAKGSMDVSKDGGLAARGGLLGRGGGGWQFDRLDKNGDGVIDAGELQAAAAERVAFASERFFRRFDADRDGKVTRAEFDRVAKERSARGAHDKDGEVMEADLPPVVRGRGLPK